MRVASVSIVGVSGYTGQETLDRVLAHPALELYALGSDSLAGEAPGTLDPRDAQEIAAFVNGQPRPSWPDKKAWDGTSPPDAVYDTACCGQPHPDGLSGSHPGFHGGQAQAAHLSRAVCPASGCHGRPRFTYARARRILAPLVLRSGEQPAAVADEFEPGSLGADRRRPAVPRRPRSARRRG